MAAYAVLVSLSKVIDLTLLQEHKYVHVCSREQMMSLHEDIGHLQDLLEHLSGRSDSSIDVLESRIRDVAYQLEDIIEYAILGSQSENSTSSFPVEITPSAFVSCATEIGILLEQAMEMKEDDLQEKDTVGARRPLTTTSLSVQPPTVKLGLNDIPVEIMDSIFGRGSNLEIIPITGMGGIGKTTLARAVYQHPNTLRHFDICSWITVSQQYNINEILRGLLPSQEKNLPDARLIEFVHKRLKGRRFLIVLDDMWDEKAWDHIRNAFPDDNNKSRIILTTRLLGVATHVGSSHHVHQMQFLNDKQSWDLLQYLVGGYELWPKVLEDHGRTVSTNCRGLPLAIVATAGFLKFNMTEAYWKRVARDTKSETAANYDDLFAILSLSYTNLPPYLKPCFLYLGLFKEDYEIPTKELVRLWTAEGFLKARGSKEMEEVAEEYLEELVARSLVLVQKKRHDGRIKTFSLHDVIRDLSLRKAHEEKFSQHITQFTSRMDRYSVRKDLRRASIARYCFSEELFHHMLVRSLQHHQYEEVRSVIQHFKLIRVLSTYCIRESSQLSLLYELTNLRYLRIHIYSRDAESPLRVGESISELQNLETLIFCGRWFAGLSDYALLLPSGIWTMPRLRHLILVKGSKLPCPTLSEISCSGLQTLSKVTNFDLSRSMTAKLSNLKKLKLHYDGLIIEDETPHEFRLNNLVHLHQLEELSITSDVFTELIDLSFPHKLKKLSLKWTQVPVEKMSVIGSLPKLEVLKLKERAIQGKEWEPIEGEFVQLKYLEIDMLWYLEEWRVESEHFPQLETLIIKRCHSLKEVPAGIGEINTLQKLVLEGCNEGAVESVKEIKAEQESLCNYSLQVIIDSDGGPESEKQMIEQLARSLAQLVN